MALPKFLQPYLASYDLKRLNKDSPVVRRELTTQILNAGDDQAIRWLFRNYSTPQIKKDLKHPQRGTWFKRALFYWTKIFNLKVSPDRLKRAIFNLDPYVLPKNFK